MDDFIGPLHDSFPAKIRQAGGAYDPAGAICTIQLIIV
jgi:hypothetical protein